MKKLLSTLIIGLVGFTLVSCGSSSSKTESTVDQIKTKGYLEVGTSADYPPYEFKILENGKEKIVGLDIDIANEIAKDMGVELKVTDLSFDGLLVALNASKIDLVMAAMSPTEERAAAVDFSDIYHTSTQSVLVRKEYKDTLNTIESLENKKIGVQKGSLQEKMATEQIKNPNLISLSKLSSLVLDLKAGNLDAVVIETPVAEEYSKQFSNELSLSDVVLVADTDGSAIAMKKNSGDLLTQVNSTIERLKSEGLIDKFVINALELSSQSETE